MKYYNVSLSRIGVEKVKEANTNAPVVLSNQYGKINTIIKGSG